MIKIRRLGLSFALLIVLLGLANAADSVLKARQAPMPVSVDGRIWPFWLVLEMPIAGVIGAMAIAFAISKMVGVQSGEIPCRKRCGALNAEPHCSGRPSCPPVNGASVGAQGEPKH